MPELPSDIETQIRAKAMEHGRSIEDYLPLLAGEMANAQWLSAQEVDEILDGLTEGSETRPVLAPEEFTREILYRD